MALHKTVISGIISLITLKYESSELIGDFFLEQTYSLTEV